MICEHHSSNTPSWCGTQLKKAEAQLYLYVMKCYCQSLWQLSFKWS